MAAGLENGSGEVPELDFASVERRMAENILWMNEASMNEASTIDKQLKMLQFEKAPPINALVATCEKVMQTFTKTAAALWRDGIRPVKRRPRSTLTPKQRAARAKKNRAQRAARKAHRQKSWRTQR